MHYRCKNSSASNYDYYGGKGIKVCKEWDNFEKFLEDMGPRPVEMTLDRKDSNKDYTPENCRWATPKQQRNNLSGQARYTVNGLEGTLTELCAVLDLRAGTVNQRLRVHGWSVEDAFKPIAKRSSGWKS
jgi:hypothetical protein